MKTTRAVTTFALLANLFAALRAPAAGLRFESDPPGATVDYRVMKQHRDGTEEPDSSIFGLTNAPAFLKKFSPGRADQLVVQFSLADHFSVSNRYDYLWFTSNKPSGSDSYLIQASLKKSKEVIPVLLQAEGATFKVDGQDAPAETQLSFVRSNPDGPWSIAEVHAFRADYEIAPLRIKLEELLKQPQQNGRRVVRFQPECLKEIKLLVIECNEPDTIVTLDTNVFPLATKGGNGGKRLELNLTFERDNATAPWSTVTIHVSKPNFEWFSPDTKEPQPFFEKRLTREDVAALDGKLLLDGFRPVKFVASPLHYYRVDNQRATLLVSSNELSEVSTEEPGGRSPLPFVQPKKPEACIVLSRISVPPRQKRAYFAMANYDYESGKLRLAGSTIYYSEGQEEIDPIQLTTQPENEDTDPCVNFDGSEVFFSSLQNGVRCIKKIAVAGGIPYPVTENPRYIDTEPTVSKSGRLAFTRRVVGAPPNKPPAVYLQEKDQDVLVQRYGELTSGTSPCWSPNGEWIAFVGMDGGLHIVHPDGPDVKPRPLSTGAPHAYPAWDPLGTTIYFSAAKAKNQRERFQYDIWRVAVPKDGPPGKPEPLTANGSFDSAPACAGDGENLAVYFLSNRGMPRAETSTLEIYRWVFENDHK